MGIFERTKAMGPTRVLTKSGKALDFVNPDPEDILAEDIAHGLANEIRFGSQCPVPYTVSQHSVTLSLMIKESGGHPDEVLAALLHDAAEGLYFKDLATPIKILLPGYEQMEKNMLKVILAKYNLPQWLPEIVKRLDNVVAEFEMDTLWSDKGTGILTHGNAHYSITSIWSREQAKTEWLSHLDNLVNPSKSLNSSSHP